MQNVRIDLVKENALSDHGHVVVRHRRSRLVEKTRSFQIAGLDLKGVETAIAVGVEPFAKGMAGIGQWRVVWPAAAIGIDTTGLLGHQFEKDERPIRREDNLEWLNAGHLPRHAAGDAPVTDVVALAAVGLVLKAGLMDGGIFGPERRLLSPARRLAGVVPGRTAIRHASPLARPIRVFAEVDDLRRCADRPQGSGDCNGAERSRVLHEVLRSRARTQSRAAFASLRNYHTAPFAALEARANRRKAVAAPGRGRDEDCSPPPAKIPACAANAPGSSLGLNVGWRAAWNRMPSGAQLPIRSTWHLGSVSEPRPPVSCSPRVRPLPPRPPPEVAFRCSVASSVLRPHPTSHPRTCSACGYCLPEPARHKSGHG